MEIIERYFSKLGRTLCQGIQDVTLGILRSKSSSAGQISQDIALRKSINFKSGYMFVYRLLKDIKFQINDSFWRCHINMLSTLLEEKHDLKQGDNIQINVDYTTINNDFLILAASINVGNEKDISIYFSMRKYPKRKNQMNQKKMELAFFKGLKHALSKKYKYTIVADIGFSHLRIMEICEELGFDYVFRINGNLNIKRDEGNIEKLQDFQGGNEFFEADVVSWNKRLKFTVRTMNNSTWYIVSNLENTNVGEIYEKRFKIEKMFQDYKSYGYDIEKTKIKKYDRMKRLMYLITLAHALSVLLGSFVKSCKKNSANHWELVTVYLNLDQLCLQTLD